VIEIIDRKMGSKDLTKFLGNPFPEMIKFVIDIHREVVAMGGELHADAETLLLEGGSTQTNLWGGNLYVSSDGARRVEWTAMINIRPSQGNRSMQVENPSIQKEMARILDTVLP